MAIRIASSDRTSVTVSEILNPGNAVSPNWYNPMLQCFTNVRMARFKRTCTDQELKDFLSSHPELKVYTVIDHQPLISESDKVDNGSIVSVISDRQRVRDVDGEDYIDEFGRYVYITCRVGTRKDIDLRYEKEREPEFFHLQYIENER
jgi:hypothetical protein